MLYSEITCHHQNYSCEFESFEFLAYLSIKFWYYSTIYEVENNFDQGKLLQRMLCLEFFFSGMKTNQPSAAVIDIATQVGANVRFKISNFPCAKAARQHFE